MPECERETYDSSRIVAVPAQEARGQTPLVADLVLLPAQRAAKRRFARADGRRERSAAAREEHWQGVKEEG